MIEPVVISDAKEKQNEWKNNIENNMDNNKKNFVEGKDEKLNNEEKQTMLEDEGERLNIQMNEFKHANDHLNNDQKFDDQDVALQEGNTVFVFSCFAIILIIGRILQNDIPQARSMFT